jgi:hypothetical protein
MKVSSAMHKLNVSWIDLCPKPSQSNFFFQLKSKGKVTASTCKLLNLARSPAAISHFSTLVTLFALLRKKAPRHRARFGTREVKISGETIKEIADTFLVSSCLAQKDFSPAVIAIWFYCLAGLVMGWKRLAELTMSSEFDVRRV